MAILTTTIGAYPKPPYVPVANWWQVRKVSRTNPTRTYDEFLEGYSAGDADLLDRGTQEAVRDQVEAGIDIPTDGEIRREHYVYYHCRHIDGIDFEDLTTKDMRQGSWQAQVPTVRGPLAAGRPFLPDDWRSAQAASKKPVKITVPGPMTIVDSTADAFYGDEAKLGAALAGVLNVEIRALASAGCIWIQVDEPVFARYPEKALAFGIDNLSRCFEGVPESTVRGAHVCCGYPAELDTEDYPKADPRAYLAIAEGLETADVDVLSIEDAHRHNDLALLERFATTRIALGVIGIARTRVETVDEIAGRLRAALAHIDAERLIAAPDCGLTMLDRDTAWAKLANLAAAAKIVG